MRVPAGTTVVRFALYRADRSGRRTGRALARGTRRTETGSVRLRLRDRALLRRLKAGRYVLELRPGRSAADTSGKTSRARLTVVR
jgi:hypothetical protein